MSSKNYRDIFGLVVMKSVPLSLLVKDIKYKLWTYGPSLVIQEPGFKNWCDVIDGRSFIKTLNDLTEIMFF